MIKQINGDYYISCKSEGTRYGFRHLAFLYKKGVIVDKTKMCYYNRTWESYEFESVINNLLSRNPEVKEILTKMKMVDNLEQ